MIKDIQEIFKYSELLKSLVKKDVRGRYKASILGFAWSLLNPLLLLFVYALVFPYILRIETENYVMFVFVVLIPWNTFITSLQQGCSSVVYSGGILKKVYLPRLILPLANTTSNMINCLLAFVIVFVALIISGIGFSKYILLLPFLLIIQYFLTLGCSFVLSAVTVFIRDLEYIINVILMLLFYVTPIIYSFDSMPANIRMLFSINPIAPLMEAYRNIMYDQVCPNLNGLIILFVSSIVILFVGYKIFKKLEKDFVEEL